MLYLFLGVGLVTMGVLMWISRDYLKRLFFRSNADADTMIGDEETTALKGSKRSGASEVHNAVSINIRPESPQIHVMFVESSGVSQVRGWLLIENKHSSKVTLERVNWELWLGQLVKSGIMSTPAVIPPNSGPQIVEFKEVFNEIEAKTLAYIDKDSTPTCYLEGNAYFASDEGRFQKKFALCNVTYGLSGKMMQNKPKPEFDIQRHLDSLTGFVQRKFLEDHLQTIIDTTAYRHPVSFIMIDVDNFKTINDTYGHLVGDDVIKKVCSQIRDAIGDKGIPVRYGGDEFSIVLECFDNDEAALLAQKIKNNIERYSFKIPNGGELKITVSIGVATIRHITDYRLLIQKADDALRQSKQHGKNQVTVEGQDQQKPAA